MAPQFISRAHASKLSFSPAASSFSPYFAAGSSISSHRQPPRPHHLMASPNDSLVGNGHAGGNHVAVDIPETHKNHRDEAQG